jgi:hypothetical protein
MAQRARPPAKSVTLLARYARTDKRIHWLPASLSEPPICSTVLLSFPFERVNEKNVVATTSDRAFRERFVACHPFG